MSDEGKKIHLLDEGTINQIAAGEVVERPASVVKELIDNSIDAGATDIRVEIGGAGSDLIVVRDNGHGMDPEDARVAFVKHSTSKIMHIEDLENTLTLGFRGEALSSIASVSKVELVTRSREDLSGTRVEIEGGNLKNVSRTGASPGTEMRVKDLFYNTPARKKYLKSKRTELSHITDVVSRHVLGHPDISFTLVMEGRVTLRSPISNDPFDGVIHLLGAEVARSLIPVELDSPLVKVKGYISKPELTRSGTDQHYIYINGRAVFSKAISNAIRLGYYTLIPKNRYPVAVLDLSIDLREVDVNVHPAKRHVRMSHEIEVCDAVCDAVENALKVADLVPEVHIRKEPLQRPLIHDSLEEGSVIDVRENDPCIGSGGNVDVAISSAGLDNSELSLSADDADSSGTATVSPAAPDIAVDSAGEVSNDSVDETAERSVLSPAEPDVVDEKSDMSVDHAAQIIAAGLSPVSREKTQHYQAPAKDTERRLKRSGRVLLEDPRGVDRSPSVLADIKIVGQVNDLYIIAEKQDGMMIIDQHAAHERVMYEQIKSRDDRGWQELLTPVTLELSSREKMLLEEYIPHLEEIGFAISEFGPNSYVVTAVPGFLGRIEQVDTVHDMITDLLSSGKVKGDTGLYDSLCKTMACRAAIKAGAVCSMEQMSDLISQLDRTENPYTCPHGRPTMISFTRAELDKLFKRTG